MSDNIPDPVPGARARYPGQLRIIADLRDYGFSDQEIADRLNSYDERNWRGHRFTKNCVRQRYGRHLRSLSEQTATALAIAKTNLNRARRLAREANKLGDALMLDSEDMRLLNWYLKLAPSETEYRGKRHE